MFIKKLTKHRPYWLVLSSLIIALTVLSVGKGLEFGFWRDDWLYIWGFKISGNPLGIFQGTKLFVSYPLDYYRLLVLSWFLNTNPLGWQFSSLLFRAIVPFVAYYFAIGLTKSKFVAFVSSLFIAAGVGGLEPAVFLGANNVTFYTIFLLLGFYFWIKSLDKVFTNKAHNFLSKEYLIGIIILGLITKGEMWSYYIIPIIALSWDVLIFFTKPSRNLFKTIICRNLLFWCILLLLFFLPPNGIVKDNGLNKLLGTKKSAIKNLLASLGNLVRGSFIPIPENGGLSSSSISSIYVGALVLLFSVISTFVYLIRPTRQKAVFVFFFLWFLIFYFPNWVFESSLVVGASHRYLAISSLAFYILLAFLLSKVKQKTLACIFICIFLITNIKISNFVLDQMMPFRSQTVVDGVITTMTKNIPDEQQDFVIYYAGDGGLRGYLLDWSLGIPVAIKRNITDRSKFAIWTGNRQTVLKLLCGNQVDVNLVGRGETIQRGGYPWSKLQIYSYYVKDNGQTLDNSKDFRSSFNIPKDCEGINEEI